MNCYDTFETGMVLTAVHFTFCFVDTVSIGLSIHVIIFGCRPKGAGQQRCRQGQFQKVFNHYKKNNNSRHITEEVIGNKKERQDMKHTWI